MVSLIQAIEERHSVRSYTDEPIDEGVLAKIEKKIEELNEQFNVNIQIVLNEPEAFNCLRAKYGKFKNVKNYLALIGPDCKELNEVLGYAGEQLVLMMQQAGLNTCWVGASYKTVMGHYFLPPGYKLAAVICFGHGSDCGKPHKTVSPQTVAPDYDSAPLWYKSGVDAALLAPTALNQQKFRFRLTKDKQDGSPLVELRTKRGPFATMDMGIAKLHFEIGANECGGAEAISDDYDWA